MGGGRSKGFKESVITWQMGIATDSTYTADELTTLGMLQGEFSKFLASTTSGYEWPKYPKPAADKLLKALEDAYHNFGGRVQDMHLIDADIPRPFSGDDFIRSIEANAELMKTTEYIETMLMRIRTLLSDAKLKRVIVPDEEITLDQWMDQYICPSNSVEGAVTVIDLSLVPAELTHIITAVIARMVLESLQRYRKIHLGIVKTVEKR